MVTPNILKLRLFHMGHKRCLCICIYTSESKGNGISHIPPILANRLTHLALKMDNRYSFFGQQAMHHFQLIRCLGRGSGGEAGGIMLRMFLPMPGSEVVWLIICKLEEYSLCHILGIIHHFSVSYFQILCP